LREWSWPSEVGGAKARLYSWQPVIGFPEDLLYEGAILALLRRKFLALGRLAEIAGEGDGEDAHVRSVQFLLNELPILNRRRVDAGGEKDDGLFSGERREPVDRSGEAGGEIEVGIAASEIDVSQRGASFRFVGREIEQELRISGITGYGDADGGSDGGEESVRGEKMVFGEEKDGGAGFDEEYELRGFFDGEEVGDGLLDVVVEEVEVFAAEAGDEVAGGVGDGDAHVYAADVHPDWRSGFLRLSVAWSQDEKEK
jgi:hypothetical protein